MKLWPLIVAVLGLGVWLTIPSSGQITNSGGPGSCSGIGTGVCNNTGGAPSCTASPSAAATAAGFTSLTLCNVLNSANAVDTGNTLAPGFLFYNTVNAITNSAGDYTIVGGALTIGTVPSTPAPPSTVPTSGSTLEPGGTTISNGFALTVDMKFDPTYNAGGTGASNAWPAFWSQYPQDLVSGSGPSTGFVEIDVGEWYNATWENTVHQWLNGLTQTCQNANASTAFSPGTGFNTYEVIVKPSQTNSGTGSITWYANGTLLTTVTYSGNGTPSSGSCPAGAFQLADTQPLAIALGAGTTGASGAASAAVSFKNLHVFQSPTAVAYYGPGDMNPGALAWWGLRAYNAAYAAANGKIVNVTLTTNSHTCDILAAANGGLGNTANCSSSPDNGQAAATFCGSNCTIATAYDQSGANKCSAAACNLTQATAADQPALTFNCVGTIPCMTFNGSAQVLSNATGITQAQPYTYVHGALYNGSSCGGANQFCALLVSNSAVTYAGSAFDQTVSGTLTKASISLQASGGTGDGNCGISCTSANVMHSEVLVFSGLSSAIIQDGLAQTIQSPSSVGLGAMASALMLGNDTFTDNLLGQLTDTGVWAGAFTTTQAQNMCRNQFNYGATAAAC